MRRGQKTSAEQVVLRLRQIEVQTAQGKSLALACKEAEISEQTGQHQVPAQGAAGTAQSEEATGGTVEEASS